MRTTIVPAQITTVEDKIAGNLNMTQIFLLLVPIFFGSIIYMLFPQPLQFTTYKIVLMVLIVTVCCTLAIRIKGRVLIQWIAILFRYNNRPRYFIANKNEIYLRDIPIALTEETVHTQVAKTMKTEDKKVGHEVSIAFPEIVKLEQALHHPKAKLKFSFAKKGGLNVSITQIKQ